MTKPASLSTSVAGFQRFSSMRYTCSLLNANEELTLSLQRGKKHGGVGCQIKEERKGKRRWARRPRLPLDVLHCVAGPADTAALQEAVVRLAHVRLFLGRTAQDGNKNGFAAPGT